MKAGGRFRRVDRLRRPEEFAAVMASVLRKRGGCFELRYRSRQDGAGNGARLGLVFPKRLARRAVLRNLLKRLARESFRQALPDLGAVDAVLRLVKPPLAPASKADSLARKCWRRDIDQLLASLAQ